MGFFDYLAKPGTKTIVPRKPTIRTEKAPPKQKSKVEQQNRLLKPSDDRKLASCFELMSEACESEP